jgi:hypothetical protein
VRQLPQHKAGLHGRVERQSCRCSLFSSSTRMWVSAVIRNHNNIFLAACSPLLDVVTSPKIAEALTVRHLPEKKVWTDLSCFRIVSLLSNRSTLQWRIDLWSDSELWWRMSKPSPRLCRLRRFVMLIVCVIIQHT